MINIDLMIADLIETGKILGKEYPDAEIRMNEYVQLIDNMRKAIKYMSEKNKYISEKINYYGPHQALIDSITEE